MYGVGRGGSELLIAWQNSHPVDKNVKRTSYQRRCDVASTSIRRCFDIMCPLGSGKTLQKRHGNRDDVASTLVRRCFEVMCLLSSAVSSQSALSENNRDDSMEPSGQCLVHNLIKQPAKSGQFCSLS